MGSAMRIYREFRLTGEEMAPLPHLETPLAYADFPKEVLACPLRWITPIYNVVQKTEMPKGGHLATLEQPDLLLDDIRKFFAKVPCCFCNPSRIDANALFESASGASYMCGSQTPANFCGTGS